MCGFIEHEGALHTYTYTLTRARSDTNTHTHTLTHNTQNKWIYTDFPSAATLALSKTTPTEYVLLYVFLAR